MSMPTMIGKFLGIDWLFWWQLPLVLLLIAILVFWKIYRNKQM